MKFGDAVLSIFIFRLFGEAPSATLYLDRTPPVRSSFTNLGVWYMLTNGNPVGLIHSRNSSSGDNDEARACGYIS